MKRHVCVDARLYFASGIGTHLRSILKELSQEFDLSLLCHTSQREELTALASNIVIMKSPIFTLKEQWEYVKNIPRCDLFLAPHFNVPLFPIRAKKRLTIICDVYHLAHLHLLTMAQKIYAKLLYNAAFLFSDRVLTISEFSKKEILKFSFFKPKKLTVAKPILNFTPLEQKKERQDFLLYVGNLKPHKNLVRLVKAFAQLQLKRPLYIVGKRDGLITVDEQLFHEIQNSSFLQNNVYFTGYVSEKTLKELYTQASVFVFPSTYEGFGYPPLEAMACGCPVVASTAASIPEICEDAVEYVDPFSIDSIAQGIARVLNDPARRAELVQKGEKLIQKMSKQKNRIREIVDACCNSS